jgi:hypothetical protein
VELQPRVLGAMAASRRGPQIQRVPPAATWCGRKASLAFPPTPIPTTEPPSDAIDEAPSRQIEVAQGRTRVQTRLGPK